VIDRGLLRVVAEDLDYICQSWPAGEIPDSELRRASTLLRKLLLDEKLLFRVWVELVGREGLMVFGNNIQECFQGLDLRELTFASVGGALSQGVQASQMIMVNRAMSDAEIKARYDAGHVEPHEMPIRKFLSGHCMVVDHTLIKRDDVIRFVANKLGGSHYDQRRASPIEAAMEKALNYEVAGRGSLYYELLTVGQTLASSPSIARLRLALQL
jgi:hypothetical protein